jgi:hypothetical protein
MIWLIMMMKRFQESPQMQVARWFEQVKDRGVLIELPDHFNNRRVEIIVLTVDEPPPVYRRTHPDIAGQVKIHGDILNSVPETEWDLPG